MATIQNTIVLNDKATAALENILAMAKRVDDQFDRMIETMEAPFKASMAQVDKFYESINRTSAGVEMANKIMAQGFEHTGETIKMMTKAMEKQDEFVRSLTKPFDDAEFNLMKTTRSVEMLMGNFVRMPPILSQAVSGATGLNKALAASAATSKKFMAALGPVALIGSAAHLQAA